MNETSSSCSCCEYDGLIFKAHGQSLSRSGIRSMAGAGVVVSDAIEN